MNRTARRSRAAPPLRRLAPPLRRLAPRRLAPPLRRLILADLGLLLASFTAATAIAALLGAANFGTALTFGELAFSATLLWVILRR
jgi:hypothetical protein